MISIVICCRTADISEELKENISKTIGVPFELIVINNSEGKYSIFEAYNIGVKKSTFSILCFMHDDILYHTTCWGEKVLEHFQDINTGMIGVGGARFLSKIPSIWWAPQVINEDEIYGCVCHYSIDTNRYDITNSHQVKIQPLKSDKINVVVLDGLWFCVKKEVFKKIYFDEKSYDGFHFYDLDISMQIFSLKWNIFVVYDILIEHFFASKHDDNWIASARVFYDKWGYMLPQKTYYIPKKIRSGFEYRTMKVMTDILIVNKKNFSFFHLREFFYFLKYGTMAYIKKKIKIYG